MPNLPGRLLAATCLASLSLATPPAMAAAKPVAGASPALCGPGDKPEPGIQGDVPAGTQPRWHCGVSLVSQLPVVGNVQGHDTCAYVRERGGQVHVIDVRNPRKPVRIGAVPVLSGSETMRVVATAERAVLVSGSSVYDIRDCRKPVLLGEIAWPPLGIKGIPQRSLPHDIRLTRAGTRVYASFGLWEADISNLADPASWKVTDHRCTLSAQVPGAWTEVHRQTMAKGRSLCADSARPAPMGADNVLGASPLHASVLWPQISHTPDSNADGTRLYLGDQAGGSSALWAPVPKVRIVDMTGPQPKVVAEVNGPGHGMDWFRVGGREYILHSNEGGTTGILQQPERGDTCQPYPRPTALGWGFEVLVSDVTEPAAARNVSMLRIAINDPEHCAARKASGKDPWIAYHLVDNPLDARFAAVNFGTAGLRIFDIRRPETPREVAYFNHGELVHGDIGHFDAKRGLLYVAGADGFKVLSFQPAVRRALGI